MARAASSLPVSDYGRGANKHYARTHLAPFGSPGPTITRFMRSRKRIRVIIGPLGSAKTVSTVHHMLQLMTEQKVDANGKRRFRVPIIRNTFPDLETTTIPDFREVFTDEMGDFKMSSPPTMKVDFQLPDGTICQGDVFFLALDRDEDVRKLRGTQFSWGWVNEIKEVPKAVIDMLDSRIGRYPARAEIGDYWHGIVGDCNAPDDDHYLYKFWEDPPDTWEFFMQPGGVLEIDNRWVLNPNAENVFNLPKDYYHNLMQGKAKDWISVNLANNWGTVRDGKPVHPDFHTDTHVSKVPLELGEGTVYVGIDFGRTPAATFGQRDHLTHQWRILGELCTENMGALKFGKILKTVIQEKFSGYTVNFWGDPAGEAMSQTRDETPFEMLAVSGIDAYPTFTNDPILRQAALDNMLMSFAGPGQPSIIIDPSCKKLIKGLNSGYHFRRVRVTGTEAKYHDKPDKNSFSHVCESLHYMLIGAGEGDFYMETEIAGMKDIEKEPEFDGWHPDQAQFE